MLYSLQFTVNELLIRSLYLWHIDNAHTLYTNKVDHTYCYAYCKGYNSQLSIPSIIQTLEPSKKILLKLELHRAHTPHAAASDVREYLMVRELDDVSNLLTTFTYILCQVVRMSREHIVGSVHRRGQKTQYLQCSWALPNNSKHTEASFSAILTDTLYSRVAQMPRSPDLAIFVLTTDNNNNDRQNRLHYPLHMHAG